MRKTTVVVGKFSIQGSVDLNEVGGHGEYSSLRIGSSQTNRVGPRSARLWDHLSPFIPVETDNKILSGRHLLNIRQWLGWGSRATWLVNLRLRRPVYRPGSDGDSTRSPRGFTTCQNLQTVNVLKTADDQIIKDKKIFIRQLWRMSSVHMLQKLKVLCAVSQGLSWADQIVSHKQRPFSCSSLAKDILGLERLIGRKSRSSIRRRTESLYFLSLLGSDLVNVTRHLGWASLLTFKGQSQ